MYNKTNVNRFKIYHAEHSLIKLEMKTEISLETHYLEKDKSL
jgi:hypothetical protein